MAAPSPTLTFEGVGLWLPSIGASSGAATASFKGGALVLRCEAFTGEVVLRLAGASGAGARRARSLAGGGGRARTR